MSWYLPLVSGLVSPAGGRCAAPPAARGALPESPPAEKQTDFYEAFYDCRVTLNGESVAAIKFS